VESLACSVRSESRTTTHRTHDRVRIAAIVTQRPHRSAREDCFDRRADFSTTQPWDGRGDESTRAEARRDGHQGKRRDSGQP